MRLVTLGDSITDPAGSNWPGYLTLRLAFIENAGVSGERTADMLARLSTDVLAYAPTDVVVLGGTNDVHRYDGDTPLATSLVNLGDIIDGITGAGATAWLLTIPPRTGYVATVQTFNAALPALAAAHAATLIDIWTSLAAPGGDWVPAYTSDGIHPTAAGAQIIAAGVQARLEPLAPPWAISMQDMVAFL